jgi:hypothetical protein
MPVSENYKEQYRIMHDSDPRMFPGQQTLHVAPFIERIIKEYGCKTVLDYGCGKGLQYSINGVHLDWGVELSLFDIGVLEYSIKPEGTYDLVISTDMLEHCETEDIPEILRELNDFADKFVLVSISTRPAKKLLPDGRNAHLTVQPPEWWISEIQKVASKPWLILFEADAELSQQTGRKFNITSIGLDGETTKRIVA